MIEKKKRQSWGKKTWHFLWRDESAWSWLANIVIAFLLIRFIVYPILGIALGTSFPIVAVVSESMEHGLHNNVLCGQQFPSHPESFNNYWSVCGSWYEQRNITPQKFTEFPLQNGFNKGDVIILWKANKNNIELGDILVFKTNKPQPIIHRVIKIWEENDKMYYQTKGDHNGNSIENIGETKISEDRLLGKAIIRIPYLGWVKIIFVEFLRPLGINIER